MNTFFPDARELISYSALSQPDTFLEELQVAQEIYFLPAIRNGETNCNINGALEIEERDIEIYFRSHGYKVTKNTDDTFNIDWDEYYQEIADNQQKINQLITWGKREEGIGANVYLLLANYDTQIDDFVNNGSNAFRLAIENESDPTISSMLDLVVTADDRTARQVILDIIP